MRQSLLLGLALLLVACQAAAPLPPPGARGSVRAWQWEAGPEALQYSLQAASVRSEADDFRHYRLQAVQLGLQGPSLLMRVHADTGLLALDGAELLNLPGPVPCSGVLADAPVIAVAQAVTVDAQRHLRLHQVQAVHGNRAITGAELGISEGQLSGEAWQSQAEQAGICALIAALPHRQP